MGAPLSKSVTTLGGYEIHSKIGNGGMSEVFKGVSIDRGKSVNQTKFAIKILKLEYLEIDEAIYSFQTEWWIGKKLRHDSLARVHDLVMHRRCIYLVIDYIDGRSLGCNLNSNFNERSMEFRIKILIKLITSLAYIHNNHVVHGDLKPSNIMICRDYSLKVIDFGLSVSPEREEIVNVFAFSPKYASPERLLGGKPSFKDDVYALGCLSHIILTGVHPFGGKTSLEAKSENVYSSDIPRLDLRTKFIFAQMLSFNSANRPANAQVVLNSLSHLL